MQSCDRTGATGVTDTTRVTFFTFSLTVSVQLAVFVSTLVSTHARAVASVFDVTASAHTCFHALQSQSGMAAPASSVQQIVHAGGLLLTQSLSSHAVAMILPQ